MKNPGEVLQKKRRSLNLSAADVANRLKISLKQLEALESNRFDVFAGAVFVHGYIRNYSKLLDLNHTDLIEAADRLISPPSVAKSDGHDDIKKTSRGMQKNERLLLIFLSFIILGVFFITLFNESDRDLNMLGDGKGPNSKQSKSSTKVSSSLDGQKTPMADPKELNSEVGLEDNQKPRQPIEVFSSGRDEILLRFTQESWVEIKNADGEIIFAELNFEGTERLIRGDGPFSLIIGNAVGVVLEFNNREVDLIPHTRVSVARLVLE